MSNRSRIRKPLSGDALTRHNDMVADGLHKMSHILQPKVKSDMDNLADKVQHIIQTVALQMKPIIEESKKAGLVDHEAARAMFAKLFIEQFDKLEKDELVNALAMVLTELTISSY